MQPAQRCSALAGASARPCMSRAVKIRRRSLGSSHFQVLYASRRSSTLHQGDDNVQQAQSQHRLTVPKRPVIYEQLKQPSSLPPDQEIINTSSLEDTLRTHRQFNEDAPPLRRVFLGSASTFLPKSIETRARRLTLYRDEAKPRKRREVKDYQGCVRPLTFEWAEVGDLARYLRYPWMQELDSAGNTSESAAQRLNAEIRAADAFFTPRQREAHVANEVLHEITTIIHSLVGSISKIDLIGSRAGGFATPLSDLDLNLVPYEENPTPESILDPLYKRMRYSKDPILRTIKTTYYARAARVPIISAVHIPTGIEFQLQCATTSYGSLEVSKCYAAEFPSVKPVFRVLKHMLKMRGSGGHGGLTSYPLLNMLAVSLKLNPTDVDPYDYGSQLLHFLDFYANFDFYKNAITHEPSPHFKLEPGSLFRDDESALEAISLITQDPVGAKPVLFNARSRIPHIYQGQDNFMMTLHDPANPFNDLGRTCHHIKHVQATFMEVHAQLKQAMSDWDRQVGAEGSAAEHSKPLLSSLLEGDYTMYKTERNKLTAWLEEDGKK